MKSRMESARARPDGPVVRAAQSMSMDIYIVFGVLGGGEQGEFAEVAGLSPMAYFRQRAFRLRGRQFLCALVIALANTFYLILLYS